MIINKNHEKSYLYDCYELSFITDIFYENDPEKIVTKEQARFLLKNNVKSFKANLILTIN